MKDEVLNCNLFHPFFYRAAGIRTRDLLNPIQAHYQAVLRPDDAPTIHFELWQCQRTFPDEMRRW